MSVTKQSKILRLFRQTPNERPDLYQPVECKHGLRASVLAKQALTAAYGKDLDELEGPENGIADALADLRHLCDRLGLDFDELNARGQSNYEEEYKEDHAT